MPMVRVYPNGVSMSRPGRNPEPQKRKEATGWSVGAARRNRRFLQSVVISEVDGLGFAVTCTLKDCPPSHDAWANLRRNYLKRLKRLGATRIHWVTEWQRRGVPHLHACAYFLEGGNDIAYMRLKTAIRDTWLSVAKPYGPERQGQKVEPISDMAGWLKYLSKHAARGVSHYQRSQENVPEGWRKTGRVWGHWGDWPTREGMDFQVDASGWYRLRRMVRAWAKAEARADWRKYQRSGRFSAALASFDRMVRAGRMLKSSVRAESACRGVSDWVTDTTAIAFLALLSDQGHDIEQTA